MAVPCFLPRCLQLVFFSAQFSRKFVAATLVIFVFEKVVKGYLHLNRAPSFYVLFRSQMIDSQRGTGTFELQRGHALSQALRAGAIGTRFFADILIRSHDYRTRAASDNPAMTAQSRTHTAQEVPYYRSLSPSAQVRLQVILFSCRSFAECASLATSYVRCK